MKRRRGSGRDLPKDEPQAMASLIPKLHGNCTTTASTSRGSSSTSTSSNGSSRSGSSSVKSSLVSSWRFRVSACCVDLRCWLFDQSDIRASKWHSWCHPLTVFVLTVLATVATAFLIVHLSPLGDSSPGLRPLHLSSFLRRFLPPSADFPLPVASCSSTFRTHNFRFLILYWLALVLSRAIHTGPWMLYEACWACNAALLLSAVGLWLGQPLLVGVAACVVVLDQMLWYVDVTGYLFLGRFYVGVARYISWPQTPLMKKIFSTHHIWFLPYCAWLSSRCGRGLQVHFFFGSLLLTAVLLICSRIIPFEIEVPSRMLAHTSQAATGDRHYTPVYLNVNLAHAAWRDVRNSILSKYDFQPIYKTLPWNILFWNGGSLVFFLPLCRMLRRIGWAE
eukprot:GHVT01013204.1.p1 GENE.GHVT01013204.1~~GHVT01013204.1.p1  ORF type:complete len:392 (-),score=53.45 GHVT01013204.1:1098-2273(-)